MDQFDERGPWSVWSSTDLGPWRWEAAFATEEEAAAFTERRAAYVFDHPTLSERVAHVRVRGDRDPNHILREYQARKGGT